MSVSLVDPPNRFRPRPGIGALVRVAKALRADPRRLRAAERAIESDPLRCSEVAKRSYWHPNGFAKIKIFQYSHFSLRLHVWPPEIKRRGDMNPHGHRWPFASWLRHGDGVIEKRFVESMDPNADEYQRFQYREGLGKDGLHPVGPARLQVLREEELEPDGIYRCSTDAIHTIDPIGTGRMITVVVQGPAELADAPVYVQQDRLDKQAREPLSPDDLRTLLRICA